MVNNHSDANNFRGLLLLNKPEGMTSFDVIRAIRKMCGIRKIGHSGTLDPFAEGLLPILVGRYTRLASFLEAEAKTYQVTFVLGAATDTLDLTGEIVQRIDPAIIARRFQSGELDEALQCSLKTKFLGEISQIPPMYSAVKINGKALYHYARKGVEMERAARRVHIYDASVSPVYENNQQLLADARIHCSKGTYIRSWVSDLAKSIGVPAYAKTLKRLSTGYLSIDESIDLAELEKLFRETGNDQERFRNALTHDYFYPIDKSLAGFPVYELDPREAKQVLFGQKFRPDLKRIRLTQDSGVFRSGKQAQAPIDKKAGSFHQTLQLVYNNELLAMAEYNPGRSAELKYHCVLAAPSEFRQNNK